MYVDDLIITGVSMEEITTFKLQMTKLFRMSDLGKLSFYLGIEIHQQPDRITLCQTAYAKRLLEQAGLSACNSLSMPIQQRLKLSKDGVGDEVDVTYYRSIIGGLRYLTHTRPDISFAVGSEQVHGGPCCRSLRRGEEPAALYSRNTGVWMRVQARKWRAEADKIQ